MSQYRNNITRVGSANLISQALPIAATPVLSRLFSTSDFGVLAIFISTAGIFSSLIFGRVDWLIGLRRGSRDYPGLEAYSFYLNVVLIAVASFSIWAGLVRLPSVAGAVSESGAILLLLPVMVAGTTLLSLATAECIRVGDLAPVARAKIWQGIFSTALSLCLGYTIGGGLGLVCAVAVAPYVGALFLVDRSIFRRIFLLEPFSIFVSGVRPIAVKLLTMNLASFANTAGLLLPAVLVATYFGVGEAGVFSLVYRISVAPTSAITAAVSQSFLVEAKRLYSIDERSLREGYLSSFRRLFLLGAVVATCCLVGSVFVESILGAKEWAGSGFVLASFAPIALTAIPVSTLASITTVINRTGFLLAWDCVRTVGVVAVFFFSALYGKGFYFSVLCYSLFVGLMYLVLHFANLRFLRVVRL